MEYMVAIGIAVPPEDAPRWSCKYYESGAVLWVAVVVVLACQGPACVKGLVGRVDVMMASLNELPADIF